MKKLLLVSVMLALGVRAQIGELAIRANITADRAHTVVGAQSNEIANATAHIGDTGNPHGVTLSQVGNPTENKTFTMGGNTVEWRFTNPVGGMLWNLTGAWSGHVLEIIDNGTGSGSAGDHLWHMESARANVVVLHALHTGNGTALLVNSGHVNMASAASVSVPVATGATHAVRLSQLEGATNGIPHASLSGILGSGELHLSAADTNRLALALLAEAQTLQEVVTLGGVVTNGVVTIDADNVRTNTFGGFLTKLGNAVTVGTLSHVNGSFGSMALGYQANVTGDYGVVAMGYSVRAIGVDGTMAMGTGTSSEHESAFAWSGQWDYEESTRYKSHGAGTFNLNPAGGLSGFYVGETTLQSAFDGKADTNHTHAIADVTGLQTALDGKAAVENIVTGAVVTATSGNQYYWQTATNVVLSANLTVGIPVNLALLKNTATNAITAIVPEGWIRFNAASITNTIPAGRKMTFGFAIDAMDGSTNVWTTQASSN